MLKTMEDKHGFFVSKPEQEVKDFIESFGLCQKSSWIGGSNPKQIDIKIEELKLMIEFNGLIWHCEKNPRIYPKYHLDKTLVAKEAGYRLIHIFEHEWDQRNQQVKSYLRSALGKNERYVSARDTEFVELTKEETDEMLNNYHILGKCQYSFAYGLKKDGELLCLVTFGKHHRGKDELVLSRYVGKENVSVVGGLSKLTKNAFKIHGKFTTWVDLRFSDGSNWIKSGWKQMNTLPPDYFYYSPKHHMVISKQSRKKDIVNTPEEVTEHEHALIDGLVRIYDCGKIKLEYTGV